MILLSLFCLLLIDVAPTCVFVAVAVYNYVVDVVAIFVVVNAGAYILFAAAVVALLKA